MAFSLILYPVVSNYINQMNSTTIATDYEQEISHLSEEQENAMIKQAQDYNESLIGIGSIADPFSESNENQTEDDVYNNLLKIDDTGMMGYIDIPKLDVVLPVYHGTSEKVLQSGVGHLKNTSLPVGGESCHAVLSGHRGLANAKIFTDLNKMEVGDVFYIKVLHSCRVQSGLAATSKTLRSYQTKLLSCLLFFFQPQLCNFKIFCIAFNANKLPAFPDTSNARRTAAHAAIKNFFSRICVCAN